MQQRIEPTLCLRSFLHGIGKFILEDRRVTTLSPGFSQLHIQNVMTF